MPNCLSSVFLFVVILKPFYFEIISIHSILIASNFKMNDKRMNWRSRRWNKNELLRRKRMIVFFFLFAASFGRFSFIVFFFTLIQQCILWPFIGTSFAFYRDLCISVKHILHLTKMTFHRIGFVLMHEHFIVWIWVWTMHVHIEVANAFYRLNWLTGIGGKASLQLIMIVVLQTFRHKLSRVVFSYIVSQLKWKWKKKYNWI